MNEKRTTVITISRHLGSGGSYIGQQVARRLGYQYVDREILRKAAQYLGVEEDTLAGREGRLSGFWENFLRMFSVSTPEVGYVPPPLRPVYDRELMEMEAKIIGEIAEQHDAVIMGRGAAYILRDHSGLVKIFVHASKEFRVSHVMEVYKISDTAEAIALIDDSDRERGKFIHSMFGVHMADARHYHLCIDTSAIGFAVAEEMVVMLVQGMRSGLGKEV